MKKEIKVPAMGESITEATVGQLICDTGASVEVDQEVLELETDKVNQVLYAPAAGRIEWAVNVDDVVQIDQVIGYVETDATGAPAAPAQAQAPAQAEVQTVPAAAVSGAQSAGNGARISKDAFIADVKSGGTTAATPPPAPQPVQAAPVPAQAPAAPVAPAVPQAQGRETRTRMPRIRQVIAKRLVEAQQTTAMLTTFNEVDMTEVMTLRKKYKDVFVDKYGVKLGFMSFFVKACVGALEAFPNINGYIDGDELVQRHYYDIGIAVGTERGLVVPVVRDCDGLGFADIENQINNYAKQAREGTLSVDALQGGGFTITNGGIYGSLLSTPILNPPQSGILGMHKIQKRPVVVDDQVVVRPMMYLALSYDHRIVDGKEAVSFLVHVKDALEDPSRLLLSI